MSREVTRGDSTGGVVEKIHAYLHVIHTFAHADIETTLCSIQEGLTASIVTAAMAALMYELK